MSIRHFFLRDLRFLRSFYVLLPRLPLPTDVLLEYVRFWWSFFRGGFKRNGRGDIAVPPRYLGRVAFFIAISCRVEISFTKPLKQSCSCPVEIRSEKTASV